MRQIRKILRDKRGEGYIDVAVMVLCVMLVIALGVRLFPIFITKMHLFVIICFQLSARWVHRAAA